MISTIHTSHSRGSRVRPRAAEFFQVREVARRNFAPGCTYNSASVNPADIPTRAPTWRLTDVPFGEAVSRHTGIARQFVSIVRRSSESWSARDVLRRLAALKSADLVQGETGDTPHLLDRGQRRGGTQTPSRPDVGRTTGTWSVRAGTVQRHWVTPEAGDHWNRNELSVTCVALTPIRVAMCVKPKAPPAPSASTYTVVSAPFWNTWSKPCCRGVMPA